MARFLCPVCRAPRELDLRDHISLNAHIKIASTSLMFASLGYLYRGFLFGFKVLLFVHLPLWAISEFLHWSKMRKESRCPQCYFDPILYKRDWKSARKIVEDRLQSISDQIVAERKKRASPETTQANTEASQSGKAAKAQLPVDQTRQVSKI